MSGLQHSNLRRKLINDVFGGWQNFNIAVTSTGTGLGTANYRIGMFVLDSSANDWFMCTVTAGAGTWVKVAG